MFGHGHPRLRTSVNSTPYWGWWRARRAQLSRLAELLRGTESSPNTWGAQRCPSSSFPLQAQGSHTSLGVEAPRRGSPLTKASGPLMWLLWY